MGTCYNCNAELSLQQGQTKCDKCGNVIWYICNSCKEGFETADEKGKKRLECPLCGYFYCPHCGICSWSCYKFKWESEILKILAPEITQGKFPELLNKVRKITEYFIKVKTSNERKECINHVPITYAKGRIKSLLAKRDNFRVKDETDRQGFIRRIDEVTEVPIGTRLTITKVREAGSYGQEYRDAFNLLVCLGKFKITWIPAAKDKPEYAMYERVDDNPCKYFDITNLVINECPKCKKDYPQDQEVCSICTHKKGKNKGQQIRLKKRLNNKDTCQMYRGDFYGQS